MRAQLQALAMDLTIKVHSRADYEASLKRLPYFLAPVRLKLLKISPKIFPCRFEGVLQRRFLKKN
jgi:hypothetical protein